MAMNILLYQKDNVSNLAITTEMSLLNELLYYLSDHLNQNHELHLDNHDHSPPNNHPLQYKVFLISYS
jgi:hypothetical protein